MKQLSFKMRITIFTGIVVTITALSLTVVSMLNAQKQINLVVSTETDIGDKQGDIQYSVSADTETDSALSVNMSGVNLSTTDEVQIQNEDANVYIISPKNEATRRFNITSIIAMLVIGVIGMIFAYIFAGKSLKPIKELDKTVSRITEKDLTMRLPERSQKDEISSLTNSFNSMLDRLNDAFENQKRFSQNAAHELKTPIAVIKTGLQTLELDESSKVEDYKEVFSVVSRNLNRLSDIVDDLLTLTNKDSLSCENILLKDMISEVAEDLSKKYKNKNVTVIYDFEDEFFISCPEILTRRLFCNLIENAFKYNRENGSITISVVKTEYGGNVRIKDSGIGIPETEIKNIWNAFYCVNPSRSKKLGGVGLGLAIVKEIIECLGWDVSLKSQEGIYTEFIVECKNVCIHL